MADMIYLALGAIAGLVVGAVMVYLLAYQSLRGRYAELQHELGDAQQQRNELQLALQDEQTKSYQGRQTLSTRQKRLESDLAEASERMAAVMAVIGWATT